MGTRLETVPEPKYWHLKTLLSDALDSEFAVGEILPNERELAARFGVARATLRQALEQLELEGRLQRRRGVGTTVAPPRVGVDVGPAADNWPGAPGDSWHTDDCERSAAPAAVTQALREAEGPGSAAPTDASEAADTPDASGAPEVLTVRRTRMTSGAPVAGELLYVREDAVPGLPVISTAEGATLGRAVLRELNRLPLEGQQRTVELGSAGAEDARRLDRLPGAPVLVVTTRYRAEGRTAAVAVATYRADTCRLTLADQGAHESLMAS